MAELDAPGEIDPRNPDAVAAFVKWLTQGDAGKKLQRNSRAPDRSARAVGEDGPHPLSK